MKKFTQLNFPEANIKSRELGSILQIFDEVRKKWIPHTPEEWVRQNTMHYLIHYCAIPVGLIAVEMPIKVNGMERRSDIVVHNDKGRPKMVVECKAPSVKVSQAVMDQASRYNITLNAPYLMLTNGIKHFVFYIDFENMRTSILQEVPDYNQLLMH